MARMVNPLNLTVYLNPLVFFAIAYLCVFPALVSANEWQNASKVVVESTDKVLAISNDDAFSEPSEKKLAMINALQHVVDYKTIARGVMGKYYRRASKPQFQAFLVEFQTSLENTVSGALLNFKIDGYSLQESQGDDSKKGREKILIKVNAGKAIFDMVYTLSNKSGLWKITNISLDGINMGLAFRNQFAASMSKQKNDIDAVISQWNVKIQ